MRHTPGPWRWWTSNSYRRLTAEGRQDGGVLSAVSTRGYADVRVSDADARLIAAAPDLLAALQALLADYTALVDSGDAGFWILEDKPVGKQALAAIAKAIGEPA